MGKYKEACDLKRRYDEIVRKLPTRAPIFLPTEKIPLEDKVRGVERVLQIYEDRLDRIYRPRLRALREKYKGEERCFIIGNGPSLNRTDLSQLKNEITFAVNGFFLKAPELDWVPTFYVVEDHLVAEDRQKWINEFKGPIKLFPVYLAYCLDEDDDTIFFNHRPRISYPDGFDFSTNAAEVTYAGGTVTFTCMQLAYYLGFKEIYLIGVDADYDIPKDVKHDGEYNISVLDMKSDDPNHFHPDYFGKGFRWHDPHVDKMIEAYKEARRAVERSSRRIFNATIGGKLEVFDRVEFGKLFPNAKSPEEVERANRDSNSKAEITKKYSSEMNGKTAAKKYPKLLVFDITSIGDGTATGEIKRNILHGWPDDGLMQFCSFGKEKIGLFKPEGGGHQIEKEHTIILSREFDPDVILYRPVPDNMALHEQAMHVIRQLDVPLVLWIMDDWPARLQQEDPEKYKLLNQDLHELMTRSSCRLSIGEAMSLAFKQRYGVTFEPIANGIAIDSIPERIRDIPAEGPVRVRYAGSLAENMTLDSVARVARSIERINIGIPIIFEIKTRGVWKSRAARYFKNLNKTHFITDSLTPEGYMDWLKSADILIIAYNFDEHSKNYVRYSMANKMPECLGSGTVTLAHGPTGLATIDYLKSIGAAEIVDTPSEESLMSSIKKLINNKSYRASLIERAKTVAAENHNIEKIREKFLDIIYEASKSGGARVPVNMSSENIYPREACAHLNETDIVSELYGTVLHGNLMIDVGAHHGSALSLFKRMGWKIFAFEPDPGNRAYLIKHHGKADNVVIDPRAVGEKVEKARTFYASEESTGISGMLAFRETHKEVATVEVTTIAEVIREHDIDHIDFLKIDVEGYDFSVLKGVPWDRIKPDVIECEFEDNKTKLLGHTWRDICEYLVDKGYTVYVSEWHPIIRYGIRHDWCALKKYPCELEDENAWGNLLAFKEDPGWDAINEALKKVLKVENPEKQAMPGENRASQNMAESKRTANTAENRKGSRKPASQPTVPKNVMSDLTLYVRFAEWLKMKSPPLFRIGQFVMTGLRALKRRPAFTLAMLLLLAVLIVPPFLWALPSVINWLTWGAAAALVLGGALIWGVHFAESRLKLFYEHRAAMERNRHRQQITQLQGEISTLKKQTKEDKAALGELATRLEKQLDELRKIEQDDIANTRRELSGKIEDIATTASNAARKAEDLARAAPVFNYGRFQSFSRTLTKEQAAHLVNDWGRKLSLEIAQKEVHYLAHRVCMLESMLKGRLATSIEDIILRILVTSAVKKKKLHVMEIGTLFGIGLAAIHDYTRTRYQEVKLTAIDPLEGYYGDNARDILTGMPVNEDVFRENMAVAQVPEKDIILLKGMSTDEDIIARAAKTGCDVLIIDGDHSYAGVKADFVNYAPMVKRGGYIIFDDYNAQDWPDVTKFVDEVAADHSALAHVGSSWRTAVYRVVRKVQA